MDPYAALIALGATWLACGFLIWRQGRELERTRCDRRAMEATLLAVIRKESGILPAPEAPRPPGLPADVDAWIGAVEDHGARAELREYAEHLVGAEPALASDPARVIAALME